MKTFVAFVGLLMPLTLVMGVPTQHYGQPQPQPYGGYHHGGGYAPVPPPPPYSKPSYGGYEKPKHNCSVEDVVEIAEVCTPTLITNCENVDIAVKKIVDGEYCYDASQTTCTETDETIDNEICTYSYNKVYEDANGKNVEIEFVRENDVQMVTVCQPGYGGHGGYGGYGQHQYCKEIAQETQYNVPVVKSVDVPLRIGFPEAVKTCVNKPITIPRLSCETITEQKCVNQPEVEDATESVEKCSVSQGPPDCQSIEITLPKQVCREIVYGYAEDKPKSYEPERPQQSYPSHQPEEQAQA